jgi:hypothetical protein
MSSTDENHFHPNDCLDDLEFSHHFFGLDENQDDDVASRFFHDLEPTKISIPGGDGSGGIPRFQRPLALLPPSFAVPPAPLFAVPLGALFAVPPEPLFAVPLGASFADPRGSADGAAVGAVGGVTKGMVDGAAVGAVGGVTADILIPSAMAGGAADFSAVLGVSSNKKMSKSSILPVEILIPSAMAGGAADFLADDGIARKRQKKRRKKRRWLNNKKKRHQATSP